MAECARCKIDKPLEMMGKKIKDKCKRCIRIVSQNRYKLSEKGKEKTEREKLQRRLSGYDVKRYREKYSENLKGKRKKNDPEKMKVYRKSTVEKHPEKNKAGNKLRLAVFKGRIQKPKKCQKCDYEAKRIEGHHMDYSKPLEVLWLCVSCHRKLHLREV